MEVSHLRLVENARLRETTLAANHFLFRAGDTPKGLYTIQEGWAATCTEGEEEPPRISEIILPGDPVGIPACMSGRHVRSVITLTRIRYCILDRSLPEKIVERGGALSVALMRHMVAHRTRREMVAGLLRNGSPLQRLSFFFLDTFLRLKALGFASQPVIAFPLRRNHLAQVVGSSEAHVGRTLAAMRRENLVELSNSILTILDEAKLTRTAGIDPLVCASGRLIL